MNITSAHYGRTNKTIIATIDGKTIAIPENKNNKHYSMLMELVKSGDLIIEDCPKPSDAKAARNARYKRDRLLSQSDWTQVPDAPVDQQAWANYRQALRDVPQQTGFPTDIDWPTKPE